MVSMTIISNTAAERREAARQSTGEFGEHTHSAPELTLGETAWPDDLGKTHYDGQWGEVHVDYGSRTPWGPAQREERVADGIVFVPTGGHGGYKLSELRNKAIPAPYRNRSGWYDEDDDRRVVELVHFDAVARPDADRTRAERLAAIDKSIRDQRPTQWEKVNGRILEPGESYGKDVQTWSADNADEYVVIAQKTIEDGLLLVTAKRESTGDTDRFILTRAERDAAQDSSLGELGASGRFRVPEGVKAQSRPEPAPLKPAYTAVPSTEGLTAAAAKKVQSDLDTRWRLRDDGSVKTLRQQIEDGHITSKSVYVNDSGVREFHLQNDNTSSVLKVSKATFDAFEAPDTRTDADRAREEHYITQSKRDKLQRRVDAMWNPSMDILRELREANKLVDAAYERYKALRDA